MGFRFSIEHANWLAHILQPSGTTPKLEYAHEEEETLRIFLEKFSENFYSSKSHKKSLERLISYSLHNYIGNNRSYTDTLHILRDYFRTVPWISLLIPGGNDERSDNLLTDLELLRELVKVRPDDPGLILQLDNAPQEELVLSNVFPAFKTALNERTRWPGVLIWTPAGDSVFLELSKNCQIINERLHWIFSHLATNYGSPDLSLLRHQYINQLFRHKEDLPSIKILHISDIHLGNSLAKRRLPRVQTLIRSIVSELGDQVPIIPVITGDLMDSPTDSNLADVRSFMGFLDNLGVERPIVTLGNHDVREDGWLNPQFEQAINISRAPVVWYDNYEIAVACFNSVNAGILARGSIGEAELTYVGNELDKFPDKKSSYLKISALHHHPIPVERPLWHQRRWFEKILGSHFEKTEELVDAKLFMKWLNLRKISVTLHGHKHIPHFCHPNNVAIVGCGSTTGLVKTTDKGQTYMSINVLSIDRSQRLISCGLRAERIPGAGLESLESHEWSIGPLGFIS